MCGVDINKIYTLLQSGYSIHFQYMLSPFVKIDDWQRVF
jgi:hypothetical protein